MKPVFRKAYSLAFVIVLISGISSTYARRKDDNYYFYHIDGGEEFFPTEVRIRRQAAPPSSLVSTPLPEVAGVTTTTTAVPVTTPVQSSPETTLPSGDSRGWTDGGQLDVLEKIDIPEQAINETVTSGAKKENDTIATDTHKYYNYSFVPYESTWVDLDLLNASGKIQVQEHKMLSKSYRRAATIKLNFRFPFYGHPVDNITIATGGFLYTGDYVHSWLAATQYIAPLMANFDTSQDDEAKIRYADNGTALIVEWKNVYLQTRDPSQKTILEGPFTFQVVIHSNGDILFAYKELPIKITNIAHEEHPVKVGLSDAYIIDRTIFFVRRKTIYEYHRVNMKDHDITNATAIYLKALPTCNLLDSCDKCLNALDDENKSLGCMWCPKLNGCSDGMDRNRQRWLMNSCDNKKHHLDTSEVSLCSTIGSRPFGYPDKHPGGRIDFNSPNVENPGEGDDLEEEGSLGIGDEDNDVTQTQLVYKNVKNGQYHHVGIAGAAIIFTVILSIFGWFGYAYFFPHTWSGQLLIKYRPSRWHWRRGEPRYTAASIHM